MPDAVEYMPYEERVARLKQLAGGILEVLRSNQGSMNLTEALRATARLLRVAISQVKYGLTYATTAGLVNVDSRTAMVSVP